MGNLIALADLYRSDPDELLRVSPEVDDVRFESQEACRVGGDQRPPRLRRALAAAARVEAAAAAAARF